MYGNIDFLYDSKVAPINFADYYEVAFITQEIRNNSLKNVVLQFPNSQIRDYLPLQNMLQSQFPECQFYLLADNMKNSCCIDMIGASHIPCDSIFHFGPACFSSKQDEKTKIYHVLPKKYIDVDKIREILGETAKTKLIFFDCEFQHYQNHEFFSSICVTHISKPNEKSFAFGRSLSKLGEKLNSIVFIGSTESPLLRVLTLGHTDLGFEQLSIIDPYLPSGLILKEITSASSIVLKRYFLIDKAKKAKVFGILIMNPEFKQ